MSTKHTVASALLGVCLTLAVAAAPATAHAAVPAASPPAGLPQVPSAREGATWLAAQLNPAGYIPSSTTPGQPDLTSTANVVLALASAGAGANPAAAHRALTYLESHVNAYVKVDGSDGPGQLALLILDAYALGVNPRAFGSTNLVSRLLATERTSGTDKGLFGAQDPTFDGAYRQGLALAALAAVGAKSPAQVGPAETWLEAQQCPDGGWTSLVTKANPCTGNPADFEGPDTNSTALAVEGLAAQGVLGTTRANKASAFFVGAEDGDGGWGYEPNAADAPGSTDPDSTTLVIQALLALGKSPSAATFGKGGSDPVSALVSFQLASGSGRGAFFFPGSSTPNLLATYQAVPAVAAVKLPFNLAVTTSSLPHGSVNVKYSTTLAARGGNGTHTWSLVSGSSLPAGLSLGRSTGTISGKPTHAGTTTFTVEVTDTRTTSLPHSRDIAWKVLSISA